MCVGVICVSSFSSLTRKLSISKKWQLKSKIRNYVTEECVRPLSVFLVFEQAASTYMKRSLVTNVAVYRSQTGEPTSGAAIRYAMNVQHSM